VQPLKTYHCCVRERKQEKPPVNYLAIWGSRNETGSQSEGKWYAL